MSWIAVVGGGVSLGTGIYSASQTPEGVQAHSLPVQGYNPTADPLLSALSMNAGAGVGQFDPNTYMQASPVQQLLNQAMQGGLLDRRQFRLMQESLNADPALIEQARGLKGKAKKDFLKQNGLSVQSLRGYDTANRLAQSSGYGSLAELNQANTDYLGKLPGIQAQYQPVADQLRAGLLSSQGRIGQYLQDLPNLLTGDANPFIDELRNEALVNAQKYGMNPYNGLEQARSQALQRALQLIQGEQAVQAGQQQAALPIAQLRQQGGATAAQLGAGQAQMLAGALQSQQQADAAQAQQWGQLGNTLGQFGLIGADMYANRGPATQQSVSSVPRTETSSNNYATWDPNG